MLNIIIFILFFAIGYIIGKYERKISNEKAEIDRQNKIREDLEKCCYDEKLSNGSISYETKVKMSLVDMNVYSSIIIDVENHKHDSILKFFEINKFEASKCAEFIISSYK